MISSDGFIDQEGISEKRCKIFTSCGAFFWCKILGGTYSQKKNWVQEALFLNSDGVIDVIFLKEALKAERLLNPISKAIDAIFW